MGSKARDPRWNRRPFSSLARIEPDEKLKWMPREMGEQRMERMASVVFLERLSVSSWLGLKEACRHLV